MIVCSSIVSDLHVLVSNYNSFLVFAVGFASRNQYHILLISSIIHLGNTVFLKEVICRLLIKNNENIMKCSLILIYNQYIRDK